MGRLTVRLAARWVRNSTSLALRGERSGHLIGLTDDGQYIIQSRRGEAVILAAEAQRIELQLNRDPAAGDDAPFVAFNDPGMDTYLRQLDAAGS